MAFKTAAPRTDKYVSGGSFTQYRIESISYYERLLVLEVTHSGKHHRNTVFVGRIDYFLVAH
jgi:hypothetical protein